MPDSQEIVKKYSIKKLVKKKKKERNFRSKEETSCSRNSIESMRITLVKTPGKEEYKA